MKNIHRMAGITPTNPLTPTKTGQIAESVARRKRYSPATAHTGTKRRRKPGVCADFS